MCSCHSGSNFETPVHVQGSITVILPKTDMRRVHTQEFAYCLCHISSVHCLVILYQGPLQRTVGGNMLAFRLAHVVWSRKSCLICYVMHQIWGSGLNLVLP